MGILNIYLQNFNVEISSNNENARTIAQAYLKNIYMSTNPRDILITLESISDINSIVIKNKDNEIVLSSKAFT